MRGKGERASREKKYFFILYEQLIGLWVALVMDCSMNYLHSVSASWYTILKFLWTTLLQHCGCSRLCNRYGLLWIGPPLKNTWSNIHRCCRIGSWYHRELIVQIKKLVFHWGGQRGPVCSVFGEVTIEVESNVRCGEGSSHCVIMVATARQLVCSPDPVAGAWCCSNTAAADPTWQWPSWWGAVCLSRFPFSMGQYLMATSWAGEGY